MSVDHNVDPHIDKYSAMTPMASASIYCASAAGNVLGFATFAKVFIPPLYYWTCGSCLSREVKVCFLARQGTDPTKTE